MATLLAFKRSTNMNINFTISFTRKGMDLFRSTISLKRKMEIIYSL